jgi:hypothetical protein
MPNKQQIELLNRWEGHMWSYFLDLEQKENDIVCVEDLKTKELMTRKSIKSLNRQIRDWICPQCGARQRRQCRIEYFVVGSCYGNTYNTAGTAGIYACGVSNPLVDETGFGKDTMKQEARGSLVHG